MNEVQEYHDAMERMRGMEHQTHHAEAFIKQEKLTSLLK
jgi:hypothetical protein